VCRVSARTPRITSTVRKMVEAADRPKGSSGSISALAPAAESELSPLPQASVRTRRCDAGPGFEAIIVRSLSLAGTALQRYPTPPGRAEPARGKPLRAGDGASGRRSRAPHDGTRGKGNMKATARKSDRSARWERSGPTIFGP
jgi:hypothetical protein